MLLTATGALLGNWDPKHGLDMRCHHEKEVLVWEALVTLPWQPQVSYKYVLVNGEGEDGEPKVRKKT